jgi:hypothetical protein
MQFDKYVTDVKTIVCGANGHPLLDRILKRQQRAATSNHVLQRMQRHGSLPDERVFRRADGHAAAVPKLQTRRTAWPVDDAAASGEGIGVAHKSKS